MSYVETLRPGSSTLLIARKRLHKFADFELKVTSLTQENEKMNRLDHQKDEEIQRLNKAISERYHEHGSLRSQNTDLDSKIRAIVGENERLNTLLEDQRRANETLRKESEERFHRIRELQSGEDERLSTKNELLTIREDNLRVNDVLAIKIRDLETWKTKFAQLELKTQEITSLELQLESKNKEIINLTATILERDDVILKLHHKEEELNVEIRSKAELEPRLKMMVSRIERLEKRTT